MTKEEQMNLPAEHANLDGQGIDPMAVAMDAVGDALTGNTIPAPIRANALKAFSQLCSAAVSIPVAYLEGIADEKRAETQARVKLISTGANQISAQMGVSPEFARIASQKYAQKIIREQVNLDKVANAAAEQLRSESTTTKEEVGSIGNKEADKEAPPISDDWLNSFEKEACQKSTEEMQMLFGRILAGEIRRPSSFSIKTVKLIGQLDASTAHLFRRFCSLSISLKIGPTLLDARVAALNGNAGSNSLQAYGLSFDMLNRLHEYGLIISDYNSQMNYGLSIPQKNSPFLPFRYQNRDWALTPTIERAPGEFRISGVMLSNAGKELFGIVDIEPEAQYTEALRGYFQKQNLTMVEISQAKP